jgi:hypothetical protein
MQWTPSILRPAQNEVHRTAHNQDLIEVPKRALLDREAEGIAFPAGRATHSEISKDSVFDPVSAQK